MKSVFHDYLGICLFLAPITFPLVGQTGEESFKPSRKALIQSLKLSQP